MTSSPPGPRAVTSRIGSALALLGGAVALLLCALTGRWGVGVYIGLGLFTASLSLLRLAWGFTGLLVLFLFEVLSRGHGEFSPARTTGMVVGGLAVPALAWRLRQEGWGEARPSLSSLSLAALLALTLASIVVAVDLAVWLQSTLRMLLFGGLWALGYACVQSWRELRVTLWVVFATACGMAAFGLAQHLSQNTILPVAAHDYSYSGLIRTTGMTTRPHSFAFILVTAAGYGMALATWSARPKARWAALTGVALIAGALATTMVRSSMAAGLGALALTYLLSRRLGATRRRLIGAAPAALGLLFLLLLPSPARTRVLTITTGRDPGLAARFRTNLTGLLISLHNPLGVGAGNAEHYYDLYCAADDPGWQLSSHDTYLELADTVGWIGLLSFLLFIWAIHARVREAELRLAQRGAIREARLLAGLRAVVYAFLAQAFFWHQILTDKLIWATLGIVSAGAALPPEPADETILDQGSAAKAAL